MAERVTRVRIAISPSDRDKAGRISACTDFSGSCQPGKPPAGNHCQVTAKASTSTMPNQKFGTEMPIWVKPMTPQSPGRRCFQAANTPSGMATSVAHDKRHGAERQGDDQAVADELGDRGAVGVAVAEIEGQQPADPLQVARQQRLVEAVLGAQRGQRIGPRVGAQHDQRRIAGQHLDHGEDDDRGERQRYQRGGEAAGEEFKHQLHLPRLTGEVARRAGGGEPQTRSQTVTDHDLKCADIATAAFPLPASPV